MATNIYINSYDDSTVDKAPSCTIRRHSKVDLNKSDMLQLLSYLEGELQARDVVVATLQAEGIKGRVVLGERGDHHPDDPLLALQRDSDIMNDYSFGEAEVRSMYDEQLVKLETLIETQQRCQRRMRGVVGAVENQYRMTCVRTADEEKNHERNLRFDQSILKLLEKDKIKLTEELEYEERHANELEMELKEIESKSAEEEKDNDVDYEMIAAQLIKDQSTMIQKVALLRAYSSDLDEEMRRGGERVDEMQGALNKEAERLMQEEAMHEKRLSEFDFQRQQLLAKLNKAQQQQQMLHNKLQLLNHGAGGGDGEGGGGDGGDIVSDGGFRGSGDGGCAGGNGVAGGNVGVAGGNVGVVVDSKNTNGQQLQQATVNRQLKQLLKQPQQQLIAEGFKPQKQQTQPQQQQFQQQISPSNSTTSNNLQHSDSKPTNKNSLVPIPINIHSNSSNNNNNKKVVTSPSPPITMATINQPGRPQQPANITRLQQKQQQSKQQLQQQQQQQAKQQLQQLQQPKQQQPSKQQYNNKQLVTNTMVPQKQLKSSSQPSSSSPSLKPLASSSKPALPIRKPPLSKIPPPIPPNKPSFAAFLSSNNNAAANNKNNNK